MRRVGGYKENLTAFGGLNTTETCGDNEFKAESNLGSSHYPYLSPREKRSAETNIGGDKAKFATSFIHYEYQTLTGTAEAVLYATYSGNNTVFHTTQTGVNDYTISGTTVFPKQFVRMGGRIVIHPDMVVLDTVAKTWRAIRASVDYSAAGVVPCTKDGVEVDCYTSNNPPATPNDGDYLYELSTGKYFQYSSVSSSWVEADGYFLFETPDTYDSWDEGDTLHFESTNGMETDYHLVIDGDPVVKKEWTGGGTNYYVLKGYFTTEVTSLESGTDFTVSRRVPPMDFICSSGNRLWGCRFGDNLNEIYASALGNPFAWYLFEGTSMDSYAVSIGDGGAWTGAIEYQGYPTFFKENMIFKIYGSYPAQYQVNKTECLGVKAGCGIGIMGGVLYYGSSDGVCAYTGSYPSVISEKIHYGGYPVVAKCIGGVERFLYVGDDSTQMFVYDAEHRIWHNESVTDDCLYIEVYKGKVYCGYGLMDSVSGRVYKMFRTDGDAEQDFDWYGETKPYPLWNVGTKSSTYNPDNAYLAEIQMRVQSNGGSFAVSVAYDNGSWNEVYSFDPTIDWRSLLDMTWADVNVRYSNWSDLETSHKSGIINLTVHIRLKRFSTVRLKIAGHGDVKVCSLTKHWRGGSDSTWK